MAPATLSLGASASRSRVSGTEPSSTLAVRRAMVGLSFSEEADGASTSGGAFSPAAEAPEVPGELPVWIAFVDER